MARKKELEETLVRKTVVAVRSAREKRRRSEFQIHAPRIVTHAQACVVANAIEQVSVVNAVAGTAPQQMRHGFERLSLVVSRGLAFAQAKFYQHLAGKI